MEFTEELQAEPIRQLDKFWNMKTIWFSMFTEYEETDFQNN